MGCTAPLASHYDPLANLDDGSCDFFETTCQTLGLPNWEAYDLGIYAGSDTLSHMVATDVFEELVLHLPSLVVEPTTGTTFQLYALDSLVVSGLPPGLSMPPPLSPGLPNTQQCLSYSG